MQRRGEIAVILAVDDKPWAEIEELSSRVRWVTVSRDILDEVIEILKKRERASEPDTQ